MLGIEDMWGNEIQSLADHRVRDRQGVGIGVLARPNLEGRFMTVKSRREPNRAIGVGGVFVLARTTVAFTTGVASSSFFAGGGLLRQGRTLKLVNTDDCQALLQAVTTAWSASGGTTSGKPDERRQVARLLPCGRSS